MSQEEFDKVFLALVSEGLMDVKGMTPDGDYTLGKGSNRFELMNTEGHWMFDINYEDGYNHFWYSYKKIHPIFTDTYKLNGDEIHQLMMNVVERVFGLVKASPCSI